MKLSHTDRTKRREKMAAYAGKHGKAKSAVKFGVTISTITLACREHRVEAKK